MSAASVQLDLFGEVEQAQQEASERVNARAAWQARFGRADWIAPWDTADGRPKGSVTRGWRCPDPDCGEIEPNDFLLSITHGFDPNVPGHRPLDGRCAKLRMLAGTPG